MSETIQQPEFHVAQLPIEEVFGLFDSRIQFLGNLGRNVAGMNDDIDTVASEVYDTPSPLDPHYPDQLASHPEFPFTAQEVGEKYRRALLDGRAIGSIERLFDNYRGGGINMNPESRKKAAEFLATWEPGSAPAFAVACDKILERAVYGKLPPEQQRECVKLFAKLASLGDASSEVFRVKQQWLEKQIVKSVDTEDIPTQNAVRKLYASLGFTSVTVNRGPSPDSLAVTKPADNIVSQPEHSYVPEELGVATESRPKASTVVNVAAVVTLGVSSLLTFPATAEAHEPDPAAIAELHVVDRTSAVESLPMTEDDISTVRLPMTEQDRAAIAEELAAEAEDRTIPLATPVEATTTTIPVSEPSSTPDQTAAESTSPEDVAGQAAVGTTSAPTIPTAALSAAAASAEIVSVPKHEQSAVTIDPQKPVVLKNPDQLDKLAMVPTADGDVLWASLDYYAEHILGLEKATNVEGNDFRNAVMDDLARLEVEIANAKGQNLNDLVTYRKGRALALLAINYQGVADRENNAIIKNLIKALVRDEHGNMYAGYRTNEILDALPIMNGSGQYSDLQKRMVLFGLTTAEAALMSKHEIKNALLDMGYTPPQHHETKGASSSGTHVETASQDSNKQPKNQFAALLDVISRYEGGKNYNAYYGNGGNQAIDFTSMSVARVLAWQRKYVQQGSPSSAVGRYQFIQGTLTSLVGAYHIPRSERFDKELQDELAVKLLYKRGLEGYMNGSLSAREFAHNLSMEWASLPQVTGSNPAASYYSGDGLNQSHISVKEIMSAVNSVKANGGFANASHESASNNDRVPDNHAARAAYFARRLGINVNQINVTGGVANFYVAQSAWAKLGIDLRNPYRYAATDPWRMYGGQCVDWTAYKVATDDKPGGMLAWGGVDNRPDLPGSQSGNANDWDENARGAGIPVDRNLAEGAVLIRNSGSAGHAMYIEKVYEAGGRKFAVVSEYNHIGYEEPSVRVISPQLMDYDPGLVVLHFELGKQGPGVASKNPPQQPHPTQQTSNGHGNKGPQDHFEEADPEAAVDVVSGTATSNPVETAPAVDVVSDSEESEVTTTPVVPSESSEPLHGRSADAPGHNKQPEYETAPAQ